MNKESEAKAISKAMSILGRRTSERKAAAARENGKSGGRPKSSKSKPRAITQQIG